MEIDPDLSASTQSMPELSNNAVNDSLPSRICSAPVSKKGIGCAPAAIKSSGQIVNQQRLWKRVSRVRPAIKDNLMLYHDKIGCTVSRWMHSQLITLWQIKKFQ